MLKLYCFRQAKAEDEEIEEISPIEKQILDSIEALEKLSLEGDEVVRFNIFNDSALKS